LTQLLHVWSPVDGFAQHVPVSLSYEAGHNDAETPANSDYACIHPTDARVTSPSRVQHNASSWRDARMIAKKQTL
jgi:hypothetical protein